MNAEAFQSTAAAPRLREGEVHVWRVDLAGGPDHGITWLSDEERARADRFHFSIDRERFIAGRVALRCILGRYLGVEPASVSIAVDDHGKPHLTGDQAWLRFNLSHSADLLILAIAHEREIGVDVEWMRDNMSFQMLAESFLTPADATALSALPEPQKMRRFYELWTGTEARLKAEGVGLARGTHIVQPERWKVLSMEPAAGYVGALAVEDADVEIKCWSFAK